MNIAHIFSNPIIGGAETLIIALAREQILSGDSCVIINFWRDSDVGFLAAKEGVPYVEMSCFSNRLITPRALCMCWQELLRRRVDIVCTHGFRVQMSLRVLFRAKRKRPCLIGVLHGVEVWRKGWHASIDRLTSHWMDGFIGTSQEVCRVWQAREKIPKERLVCIPNGIDTQRFSYRAEDWPSRSELGLPEVGSIVLTVANYREEKGYAFLAETIAQCKDRAKELHFCWCGKGEDEESLRSWVVSKGLCDRIHFLGHIRDVRPLLAHAEIFVLPSREEGLPLALLEAMSMETACVATDVGGVSEVLRSGVNGTLIQYQDVDACSQAILRYHEHPELRREHGVNARSRVVAAFNIREMARRYDNYLRAHLKSQLKI